MSSIEKRFPVYSRLVKLYPSGYRREFGEQLLQTTADLLDDAQSTRERYSIWLHIVLELPVGIGRQQLKAAGTVMNETPQYIMQSSGLSVTLLLPFFLILLANVCSERLWHHSLHHSWLWTQFSIGIWAVFFPLLAFVATVCAFIQYGVTERRLPLQVRLKKVSVWPLIVGGVISLGILSAVLFHDSAHCVTQNLIRAARNPQQTIKCIGRSA